MRDDILLGAVVLRALMLWTRPVTRDELKTIGLLHLLGFAFEAYKSKPAIGPWRYPEFACTKVPAVPLYAGFMYVAVVIRAFAGSIVTH